MSDFNVTAKDILQSLTTPGLAALNCNESKILKVLENSTFKYGFCAALGAIVKYVPY